MSRQRRHKIFVSYHHSNDEEYRNRFERLFTEVYDIVDSKSVRIGDIPKGLTTDEVSRRIRDDYLSRSTVTVVLVGKDTWRRMHIDWEIAATVRDTDSNQRSGLIGIILPTHPSFGMDGYFPYTIPPRLHDNIRCGFANLYDWNESPNEVANWIDDAFTRRKKVIPDNSHVRFAKNWRGTRWYPHRRD